MVNRADTSTDNAVTAFQKRWPSFQAFADDAGCSYGSAQLMRYRNAIPPKYDLAIAKAAARRRIGKQKIILNELYEMREGAPV